MKTKLGHIAAISFFIILSGGTTSAASLDKVQFVDIAPHDARAVIKTADGKLRVIKAGDAIGEAATVKEIAANRIVLEEKGSQGPETVIVRFENGRTRLERLRKQPEKGQPLTAPGAISVKR